MKPENDKADAQQQGTPADEEEQIAEAVELSYGSRLLGVPGQSAQAQGRPKSAEATSTEGTLPASERTR
jgi:hypothetical protein